MKKIPLSELKPGMRLARDIRLKDGKLFLLAGFIVKPHYIRKLDAFEIPFVFVEAEDGQDEVSPSEIIPEKVYIEAFNNVKSVLNAVRDGKDLDVAVIKETVNSVVHKVINNESVFIHISGIKDIDNYTYTHSLDVCMYAVLIGKNMGLSETELNELGIGSILHDVGKCRIPLEILNKPGPLTEEEYNLVKLHATYGYDIVNSTPGMNQRIALAAYQHHERWNGSGYPLGLRRDSIDRISRIVAIADVYDAMTADKPYKKKFMPHEAVKFVISNASIQFDIDIVNEFVKNVPMYPIGTKVLLNTGEIAVVRDVKMNLTFKPKVQVIGYNDERVLKEPYEIDLMTNANIAIIDILGK